MLTRAQSLRCIHLCGNEGVTESNIEWMLTRIKGRRAVIPNEILPPGKVLGQIKVDDTDYQTEDKQDIFKLFGVNNPNQ